MRARLADGDNLILFPEGTTSDGSRVLPFRSAFFAIAEGAERAAAADPAGVGGVRPAGGPADRAGHAGRCSPGTATWTSPRISGGWRSIAACAPACCCMPRWIRRRSPTARRWRRRSGAWWPTARRRCGRTGRPQPLAAAARASRCRAARRRGNRGLCPHGVTIAGAARAELTRHRQFRPDGRSAWRVIRALALDPAALALRPPPARAGAIPAGAAGRSTAG